MTEITYLDAINAAMREEMARDERVFLIGEDVGSYGGAFDAKSFGMVTCPFSLTFMVGILQVVLLPLPLSS